MIRKNLAIFLLLLVTVNAFESNDGSLEDVIKEILKISPPETPVGQFREDLQPPKHMLELYRRFTAGRRASGETVRSITPLSDPPSSIRDTITFNLSHVDGDSEEVRLGQLVLRRRRLARHPHPLHRKLLAPPCRVRVYQVLSGASGKMRTVPLASIPVPQVSRGGWHSLDITSAVRELLLSSSDASDQLMLGVRFEAPRSKIIAPSHFLDQRDNTSAFLMLFSDETPENDITNDGDEPANENGHKRAGISRKHIELIAQHVVKQRHHLHHSRVDETIKEDNPRRHKNKNIDNVEDNDIKELIAMDRVKKLKKHWKLFDEYNDEKESERKASKIKSNLIDELLENSDTRRVIRSTDDFSKTEIKGHRRRSIFDNELPYDKLHFVDISKTLTTTDTAADMVTEVSEFAPRDVDEDDDKNLIPYPPGTERKKRRRGRRGKRKNHRSRTTKIPDEWNKEERQRHRQLHGPPNGPNSSSSNHTCSRRQLVVSFKELGWSNWIIEPKLFNAHYCAGSCSFPVPENVPVTNHAVIQGLVHERGLHKDIPAPCCVPHSMSPLTILYLEDDNHVILKNYRSMTVETCGCR